MKIAIILSSTRPGRKSQKVAYALQNEIKGKGIETDLIDIMKEDIPMFTERISHQENPPAHMLEISQRLSDANGIIFVSPEYNGSYSSALKNLVDFFGKNEFAGKPIAVATVTTGALGGIRAALQMQQLILAIQAYPQPQMLLTGNVNEVLSEEGNIIDETYKKKVYIFVDHFINFVSRFV